MKKERIYKEEIYLVYFVDFSKIPKSSILWSIYSIKETKTEK